HHADRTRPTLVFGVERATGDRPRAGPAGHQPARSGRLELVPGTGWHAQRLADSLGRQGLSPAITHVSCFGWAGSIGYPPLGILTSMCQNLPMRNDPDPIDDLALALLYLTTFGPSAASTWKNLDPKVRQRLVQKNYLPKPHA